MDDLQREINEGVYDQLQLGFKTGFREVARVCTSVLRRTGERQTTLAAEQADEYLTACITEATRLAAFKNRRSWSQYESLFYLRRLADPPFEGSVETTAPYDRVLSEIICTVGVPFSRSPGQEFKDGLFPFSRKHARIICNKIGFARALSALHVTYRYCGKGAPLSINSTMGRIDHPFPDAQVDTSLRRATSEYDSRVAAADVGGQLGFPTLGKTEPREPGALFVTGRLANGPKRLPFPLDKPQGYLFSFFGPTAVDASAIRTVATAPVLDDPRRWDPELPALAAILGIGNVLFTTAGESQQANYFRTGYMILRSDEVRQVWGDFRDHVAADVGDRMGPPFESAIRDIDDLVQNLADIEPEAWPPRPGAIVFQAAADMVGLNLAGATDRLLQSLRYPSAQGDIANIRASQFESSVQTAIDATEWRPASPVHELVGRHLQLDGERIGEVDAIACRGKTLMLVSCKSFLYGAEYDRGSFRAVRSVRRTLESAEVRWDELLTLLRMTPEGDNYDFNGYEIVGVLLSPRPFYVEEPLLSRMALPGLRFYSSYEEFNSWMLVN